MSGPLPASIAGALARLTDGSLAYGELAQSALDRIAALDDRIHAWAHVDADGVRAAAERLDAERANPPAVANRTADQRQPSDLTGIPIGVKDIIDVAGMPTGAGSPLRKDWIAIEDAPVVAALRRSGAIILGKTVTCEWACFDPAPTRNPWNLAHTPGGSSSGSAAAVAAGMCLGAIGTQTGGSIIRPAAYCGVVGVKPTFSPRRREGVVPVSPHLDHLGAFARSVADAFRMLLAAELIDPAEAEAPASCRSGPFRLGTLDGMFVEACDDEMQSIFAQTRSTLSAAGIEIVRLAAPNDLAAVARNHRAIMAYDAARFHAEAFAARPEAFGPQMAELLGAGLSIGEDDYQAALAHWRSWGVDLDRYFDEVDALAMPATPSTAPASLATTGDPRFNVAWSYAGAPAVTTPMGVDAAGLPAGLQLVGARGKWRRLAAVAAAAEQAIDFRQRPAQIGAGCLLRGS